MTCNLFDTASCSYINAVGAHSVEYGATMADDGSAIHKWAGSYKHVILMSKHARTLLPHCHQYDL